MKKKILSYLFNTNNIIPNEKKQIVESTPESKIHYTLRIASAFCFIGHGAWGITKKPGWTNYFMVFGISHQWAYRLMPYLGAFDIICGLILLIYPLRAIPFWLVIWGFVTALLRPLSGEPFPEFIERAGNYGAPLALLLLSGGLGKNIGELFSPLNPNVHLNMKAFSRLKICLQIIVFLLLCGHGWLNLMGKKGLIDQYTALGFADPYQAAHIIGLFEICAGLSVLIRPLAPLLLILFFWKMCSELFYPKYEFFEWLERGGSYGALLALWFVVHARSQWAMGSGQLAVHSWQSKKVIGDQ